MKKAKKLFVNIVALLLIIVSCFSLSACKEDIKQVKMTISVYDYSLVDGEVVGEKDVTLKIDLYRHLAKNTVDTILGYIKEGYYNNTVFYKFASGQTSQIMLGEIKVAHNVLSVNQVKPQIPGEFEAAGVKGSNLYAQKGSIGLWRDWYASVGSYNQHNDSLNSGRANLFMPTSAIDNYNDYFCIFAQINLSDKSNSSALQVIIDSFKNAEQYKQYVVYYVGDYDETKPNENFGLQANIVDKNEYDENENKIDNLFTVDDSNDSRHLAGYNPYTINVPTFENKVMAVVKSVSIVK